MNKKRNKAVIGFGIFLALMAVCTVVAKGIYASGLPRATVGKPAKKSISHDVKATGSVRTGGERGVYTESGLRVAEIMVRSGQTVAAGDILFRIDTGDLESIIAEKEKEAEKLRAQEKEAAVLTDRAAREERKNLDRAKLDAQQQILERESEYNRKRLAVTQAQKELEDYQAYLKGAVSGGDREQSGNEKLRQLEQALGNAAYDAEQAGLKLDDARRQAGEAEQDAAEYMSSCSAARETARLEAEAREGELAGLRKLLEADGFIYADVPGLIIAQKLTVGERTPDTACLLYAPETGKRIVDISFDREQMKYISLGDVVQLEYRVNTGESRKTEAPVAYMESQGGNTAAEIYLEDEALAVGQNVNLEFARQSEPYELCIPISALHSDGRGTDFIYVVEEREGFLGAEWRVRKLPVSVPDKNDSYAAIEAVGIDRDTRILFYADKEIADGTVVRIIQQ